MPMRGLGFVMVGLLCALLLAPAVARADRPFGIRYTTNDVGSIAFAANTLMTCPDSAATCANARLGGQGGTLGNNNGYAMTYVDVDGPGNGTFDSSTATLVLPPDAFVLFAGLYWAGDTSAGARGTGAPTPAARGTVLLRVPGAAAYGAVSAATLDSNGTRFSGFANVTDSVRQAGPGAYTVANVQSGTGEDRYGAWDLVVAYRDPTQPARNLTVFDGLATINQGTSATLSLSGFTTPSERAGAVGGGADQQRGRPHVDGRQRDAELHAPVGRPQPAQQRLQLVDQPARCPLHAKGARLRQPVGLRCQLLRGRRGAGQRRDERHGPPEDRGRDLLPERRVLHRRDLFARDPSRQVGRRPQRRRGRAR